MWKLIKNLQNLVILKHISPYLKHREISTMCGAKICHSLKKLKNKHNWLQTFFRVNIIMSIVIRKVNLLSLKIIGYTSTRPAILLNVLSQQCLYHRQLICRCVLHTGYRWPEIYSINIVLYRYNRTNGKRDNEKQLCTCIKRWGESRQS